MKTISGREGLVFISYNNILLFSLNLVRVRDVIADNPNTFEIHKLEHLKVSRGEPKSDHKSGIIMRLECESQDKKDEWVKAINSEVKQLSSTSNHIGNQFWIL